jgi:2-methylisocitrate lyase-like PEP mutase family enzyme
MENATRLRKLLEKPEIIVSVGVYDGLTAKIAEHVGFDVGCMGGYANSAVLLGKPDYGMLGLKEMADQLNRITSAANLCIIADGDTGYGNAISVTRTVQEFIRNGAAAILLEDQVWPKRCGHMEGKQVIPMGEHQRKIEAAVKARGNDDLVIIGRTDARQPNGIEDAIKRGKAYREAGADIVFVEAPQSMEELEMIIKEIDAPQLCNMIEGGKTPFLSARQCQDMGFKIVLYTLGTLYAATKSILTFMEYLKENGTTEGIWDQLVPFSKFNQLMELDSFRKMEQEFAWDPTEK